MRDIRFRAWIKIKDLSANMFYFTLKEAIDESGLMEGFAEEQFWDIEKDTPIMQYTGLKDKNNNEIYDGDILGRETNRNFIFVVSFGNGCFAGYTEPSKNHWLRVSEAMNLKRSPYVEIIGNIYENPELLKKGNK